MHPPEGDPPTGATPPSAHNGYAYSPPTPQSYNVIERVCAPSGTVEGTPGAQARRPPVDLYINHVPTSHCLRVKPHSKSGQSATFQEVALKAIYKVSPGEPTRLNAKHNFTSTLLVINHSSCRFPTIPSERCQLHQGTTRTR